MASLRQTLVAATIAIAVPLSGQSLAPHIPDAAQRATFERRLADARKQNDVAQQALMLLFIGMSDLTTADAAAGREHLTESVSLFKASHERVGEWMALLALAEFENGQTEYTSAIATYERSLAVLDEARAPGEKFSIEKLVAIGGFFGIETPLPTTGLPEELFKPMFLSLACVMTRDGYVSSLTEVGRLDDADAQLTTARQEAMLFGGLFDFSLNVHAGDLRRRQWRFDDARREYTNALNANASIPMIFARASATRIDILSRLADIEMLVGRTDAAMAWNDQALALAKESNDRKLETSVLRNRASLLWRARSFDAATTMFERALAVAQTDGARAEVMVDLALLDMTRGKYGSATSREEKAIELFHKIGDVDGEAGAWVVLSDLYSATGLQRDASEAAAKAEALARKSGLRASRVATHLTAVAQRYVAGAASSSDVDRAIADFWNTPEAASFLWRRDANTVSQAICDPAVSAWLGPINSLPASEQMAPIIAAISALVEGRSLLEKKQFAAARETLTRGLASNPSGDYAPAFLVLIGAAWSGEGNLEKAAEAMSDAVSTLELTVNDMRVDEMLTSYLGSSRSLYFDVLIETLLKQGRVAEAFEVSERARARAFLRMIGNTRVDWRRDADPDLVREADALRTEIADLGASPQSTAADLHNARTRYELLTARIKASHSEYATLTAVSPVTVPAIQPVLPEATTLVSYFITHWGVHAWLIDKNSIEHVRLPADAAALERAACWSAQFSHARGVQPLNPSDRCRDGVSSDDIYRAFFAPLRGRLSNRRLLIAPHGALHYVPFAALHDPESGKYLVEDFTISYLPSASALPFLSSKESPVAGTALVFGDPAANVEDLPFAKREAEHVAAALGTSPLLGDDAAENRLYQLNGRTDLIHIAAHGEFDAEHPLFSRIVLAAGGGRDGNLEVHEILGELDLTGVNLVVLAACQSGVGKRSGGDDVSGFTRALLYAGTPGVVATLWNIRDEASSALMDAFYAHLLAGKSVADSLRLAQIAMLQNRAFNSPNDWAAFALYGDPRGRWSAPNHEAATSPHHGQ